MLPCPGCAASGASGGGGSGGLLGGGGGGSGGIDECGGLTTGSAPTPDVGGGGSGGGGSSYSPRGEISKPVNSGLIPQDGQGEIYWGGHLPDVNLPGETVFVALPAQVSAPGAPLSVQAPVFCLKAKSVGCSIGLTLAAQRGRRATTIGSASIRLAAGEYTDSTISLNPVGAHLVRARHTVRASLLIGTKAGTDKTPVGKVLLMAM